MCGHFAHTPNVKMNALGLTKRSQAPMVSRLVPREGSLPRASVLLKTETNRWFIRCGLQNQPDNGLENIDAYSFRTRMSRREIIDQGI